MTTKKPEAKNDKAKHEDWFYKLNEDEFIELARTYVSVNSKINIAKDASYDDALNYFKLVPPITIKVLMKTGQAGLSVEQYASLRVWNDILANPHRITKFHKSGLVKNTTDKSIVEIARAGDLLLTLEAIRDKVAEKIEAGSDDMARLTQQLRDISQQIDEERIKRGPSADTDLGRLIKDVKQAKTKKPTKRKMIDDE